MTQLFDDKGDVRPVTVLQAGPCVMTQLKSCDTDGYDAAQIGLVEFVKASRLSKPMKGHFEKNNVPPVKFMREMDIVVDTDGEQQDGAKVGDRVLVDIFDGDKFVDVVGTSKGRGFAGVVKRHKFGGGPASARTHVPGAGFDRCIVVPVARFQGQRMSGHMGDANVTIRNLRILGIDKDENLLVVEGAVPGPRNGYVVISQGEEAAERASWILR